MGRTMEMMMKFVGGLADNTWHMVPDRLDIYRIEEPLEPMTSINHESIEPRNRCRVRHTYIRNNGQMIHDEVLTIIGHREFRTNYPR